MPTVTHKPTFPLNLFIDSFWYCLDECTNANCLSLPISRFELVINFSDTYITSTGDTSILANKKYWISGLQSRSFITSISGKNENVGVVFTPTGFSRFVNFSMVEFFNTSFDLSDLWKLEIDLLREQIAETSAVVEKFILLERFLLARLNQRQCQSGVLSDALEKIKCTGDHPTKINAVCKDLRISRKSLNVLFRNYIGCSPTEYRRLISFNSTLKQMNRQVHQKLSDVGYDHNYFDQSHFIKNFQSYSGLTPRQYMKYATAGKTDLYYPNYINLT